jgi:hypothetical protein
MCRRVQHLQGPADAVREEKAQSARTAQIQCGRREKMQHDTDDHYKPLSHFGSESETSAALDPQ